jgi:hypothetical protein
VVEDQKMLYIVLYNILNDNILDCMEPMQGKSPLHVVGWLGQSGYQVIIHKESAPQQKPQEQAKPVDQHLQAART